MRTVTVQKISGGLGLLLPEEAVDTLGLREGDTLEVNLAPEGGVLLTSSGGLGADLAEAAKRLMDENEDALRELAGR